MEVCFVKLNLTAWAEWIVVKRDKCREVSLELIQVGEN